MLGEVDLCGLFSVGRGAEFWCAEGGPGLEEVCCNLAAELFRRVIAAELVNSFIVLSYIAAINSCYKGSVSLNLEEDMGVDNGNIQQEPEQAQPISTGALVSGVGCTSLISKVNAIHLVVVVVHNCGYE